MVRSVQHTESKVRQLFLPVLLECPPECGIVSISRIEITNEYSYLSIYISALQNIEIAMQYMKKRRPYLQSLLSSLPFRRMPELRIHIDETVVQGERIEHLLANES
jgi:ribosome-binding factor A